MAKPRGLRTPTTESQSARRTHREKNEDFKVELARMLYVGFIDMMIITRSMDGNPGASAQKKESRGKFQVLEFYFFFLVVSLRSL